MLVITFTLTDLFFHVNLVKIQVYPLLKHLHLFTYILDLGVSSLLAHIVYAFIEFAPCTLYALCVLNHHVSICARNTTVLAVLYKLMRMESTKKIL